VRGPYGFQLSGVATISGEPKPVVSVARLTFDDDGKIGGYSSVNFDGLLLGNPVTGSYEAGTDCKLSFSLQDDSGGYQHFSGTLANGGGKADIRQTDPGSGSRGRIVRSMDSCSAATLKGRYRYSLSGGASTEGSVDADGAGNLGAGSYEVDSDCFVRIELRTEERIKLRGILVDGGRQILAIQTDPGKTVAAHFTAE
jgi:hypothetical protein